MSKKEIGKRGFGNILLEERSKQGLTYAELEKRSGLSASYIYRLEIGQRKAPGFDTILALVKALNLDMHDVLERMGMFD